MCFGKYAKQDIKLKSGLKINDTTNLFVIVIN